MELWEAKKFFFLNLKLLDKSVTYVWHKCEQLGEQELF